MGLSVDEIVAAHATYNGNANEAARNLPYNVSTILRHWDSAGLKPSRFVRRTSKLNQQQIDNIVASYDTYDGNSGWAARNLLYSVSTVLRHWRKAGLPINPGAPVQNKLAQQQIDEIVASHTTYKGNSGEAAKHLLFHGQTILKYWREAGLETRTRYSDKLTKAQRDEIVAAHSTYKGDAREAAKHLPHREHTIARYWGGSGLEVKEQEETRVTEDEKKRIVADYDAYGGNATKVGQHLHHSNATIARYWKEAGLKPNTLAESLGLNKEDIEEIIDANFTYNANALEASKHLPYSVGTIIKYWREADFRVRRVGEQAKLTKEEIGEVTAAHITYKGNALLAAKELHHALHTITKYWREAGLPIRKTGQHGNVDLK